MPRKIGILLLTVLVVWGVLNRELLQYGWMQAKGQLAILWHVREVADVLADPAYPDSLKLRIRLIEEIKQFGVDSLGLTPSANYTTFYDQQGRSLMWVLTASEKYRILAKEWKFPVLGTFPYKGFFDSTRAVTERQALIREGYDTHINEAAAWSLLGYVRDPILSSMLERSDGGLANLILHELTHGTLFVKDNLELNENLASFVGDWGAIRFLTYKYGPDSEQLKRYEFRKKYNDAWAQHMLRGANRLDSLYQSFEAALPETAKAQQKQFLLNRILADADTLLGGLYPLDSNAKAGEIAANNAYFISYKTYKSQQNLFRQEFEQQFDSDFKSYFDYLKRKYPSL